MKTTTKIIGLLMFIPFGIKSQQSAQATVNFEPFINTTHKGTSNKFSYIDLTKNEKNKIDNHLKHFFTDSNNAYYSTLIDDVYILSDFKNTNNYIKANSEFLKPYFGDRYNPIYIEDIENTKSMLSFNENWNYSNNKFTKESLATGISKQVFGKDKKFRGHMYVYTKIIKQNSIKNQLLKENVKYDFWFYTYVMDKETEECIATCKYPNEVKQAIIEKNSETINGLSQFEIKSLLTPIITDIYTGKLKIYDTAGNIIETDKLDDFFSFKKRVKESSINEKGEIFYEENAKTKLINFSYKISDIIGINFTENWYFAKNQFDIIKEVTSISFIVNDYNKKGEIIGTKKLPCIIKFKN